MVNLLRVLFEVIKKIQQLESKQKVKHDLCTLSLDVYVSKLFLPFFFLKSIKYFCSDLHILQMLIVKVSIDVFDNLSGTYYSNDYTKFCLELALHTPW